MWHTITCAEPVVLNLNLANKLANIAFRITLKLIILTEIGFYKENTSALRRNLLCSLFARHVCFILLNKIPTQ